MNTKLTVLAASAALFVSISAFAAQTPTFTPYDGGAPASDEIAGTFNGKPVIMVRISADYHQMNLPPQTAQPIGLRRFFYFLKNGTKGNAARCETWVKKVKTDEAAWTKASPTFPYLEINIAQGAKPVTINGIGVYRDADVQCWEAQDLGAPVF
jgi:hypothetical protein